MFDKKQKLAIYMEGNLDTEYGKMGFGVMRYAQQSIACVIDSKYSGQTVRAAVGQPFDFQVVDTIDQAKAMGGEVLVLGIAPSGGKFPDDWVAPIAHALQLGMSLINGLHDDLNDKFGHLLTFPNQKIWDVRKPTTDPSIGQARAAALDNKRVLMVGTDMAVGKMTAGIEIYKWIKAQGISTDFLPTGQIGITVMGKGIPLDAFKVDKACGAVEELVLSAADKDIVFIEGQGSLLNPGSTATLPLMRGSCATHLILCHRADMKTLRKTAHVDVKVPPLNDFIKLNEDLTGVCGSLTRAKTIGIALNTSMVSEEAAIAMIDELEKETGLPVTDVVRFGAEKLGRALLG